MMDCPQATVRSNLHIARSKVKQKLKEILDRPLDPDGRNREER